MRGFEVGNETEHLTANVGSPTLNSFWSSKESFGLTCIPAQFIPSAHGTVRTDFPGQPPLSNVER
jgi:hypothetical protein